MIEITVTIPTIIISAIIEASVLPSLPAIVQNSSDSYHEEVDGGDTLVLPDNTYKIYVNDVLNSTVVGPSIEDTTINIGN